MPFLLLLILTPPFLQETWPRPSYGAASPLRITCLTWTAMALGICASVLWALWARRSLQRHPERRDTWVRSYASWRIYHLFILAGLYGLSLYLFGWGWAVQHVC